MSRDKEEQAILVLEDGKYYVGESYGALGSSMGELVFTTGMTGYQESLTDPSYAGQILVQTAPHIGNTGVNMTDNESGKIWVSGYVIRDAARIPSSWRSEEPLEDFLMQDGVVGIKGVDTRAITRHIREHGAMRAGIFSGAEAASAVEDLLEIVRHSPQMRGASFSDEVTTRAGYTVDPADHGWQADIRATLAIVDLGVKATITRNFAGNGVKVHVLPANSSFDAILQTDPDGVFYSNGPGDPSTASCQVRVLKQVLAAKIPFFGICFGNQLLGQALGFNTYKLRYGHHGINQPVREKATGKVEITVHNHGFAVDAPLKGITESKNGFGRVEVSHICLNDDVVEGLSCLDIPAFSVQYHPEAAAGPHDASHLFQKFIALMEQHKDGEPYFLSFNASSQERHGGRKDETPGNYYGAEAPLSDGSPSGAGEGHDGSGTDIKKPEGAAEADTLDCEDPEVSGIAVSVVPEADFANPGAFSVVDVQGVTTVSGDGPEGYYRRSPFIVPLFSKKKFRGPQQTSHEKPSAGQYKTAGDPEREPSAGELERLEAASMVLPENSHNEGVLDEAYVVTDDAPGNFIESLKGRISEPVQTVGAEDVVDDAVIEEPEDSDSTACGTVEEIPAFPQPYSVSETSAANASDANTAAQIQDMLNLIQQTREGVAGETNTEDSGVTSPLPAEAGAADQAPSENSRHEAFNVLTEPPLPRWSPSVTGPQRASVPLTGEIPARSVQGPHPYGEEIMSADTKEKLQQEVGNFFDNIVTSPSTGKKPKMSRLFKGFRGGKDTKGER